MTDSDRSTALSTAGTPARERSPEPVRHDRDDAKAHPGAKRGPRWTSRPKTGGLRKKRAPTYAALDLGTNNCRLLIARPTDGGYPPQVLAYETLSETNWNAPYLTPNFVPNVFIDITDSLELKLAAMQAFRSQIREFPHERSREALKALATLRGATVHCRAAEAFVLVRQVVRS